MTTSFESPEEAAFVGLREWWKRETAVLSSVHAMTEHQAYQQIIAMGQPALRFILEELADTRDPDHWWQALMQISGENPACDAETAEDARQAWVNWGREKGYLPRAVTGGAEPHLPPEVWVGDEHQRNGFLLKRIGNMVFVEFGDNTKAWVNQAEIEPPHNAAPRKIDTPNVGDASG